MIEKRRVCSGERSAHQLKKKGERRKAWRQEKRRGEKKGTKLDGVERVFMRWMKGAKEQDWRRMLVFDDFACEVELNCKSGFAFVIWKLGFLAVPSTSIGSLSSTL